MGHIREIELNMGSEQRRGANGNSGLFGLGDKVNDKDIKVGIKEDHGQSKNMNLILNSVLMC